MRLLHPTEPGLVAGTDEAGRGSLAGPVTAAAVLWPDGLTHPWLNDSKKMSKNQRETLAPWIKENAISWGISFVSAQEIDRINILQATHLAMNEALAKLPSQVEHALVDGLKVPSLRWPQTPIVKGDSLSFSIAAASTSATKLCTSS